MNYPKDEAANLQQQVQVVGHRDNGNLMRVYFNQGTEEREAAEAGGDPSVVYVSNYIELVSDKTDPVELAKEFATAAINDYDNSWLVNRFVIRIKNGKKPAIEIPHWLSVAQRSQLVRSVTDWRDKGHDTYRLDIREQNSYIEVLCDTLLEWLKELEVYAVACFNKTSDHLFAVAALDSVEAVLGYDYTEGYPDMLTFEA